MATGRQRNCSVRFQNGRPQARGSYSLFGFFKRVIKVRLFLADRQTHFFVEFEAIATAPWRVAVETIQ
jgi:hypothetical protein